MAEPHRYLSREVGSRGRLVGIGLLGGVIGGLIGGGSGVLFVPALDRFTSMTRARVHGTSTIANIGVCVAGAAAYAVGGGALDPRAGTGMLIGGTLGGLLGPRLLARASDTLLRALLIVILVLSAVKFAVDALVGSLLAHTLVSPALIADPWFVVPTALAVGIVIGAWNGAPGVVAGAALGLTLDASVLGLIFGTFALLMALREIVALVCRRPGSAAAP